MPNFGKPGSGMIMRRGMVVALEPMATVGSPDTLVLDDGWTAVTADGSLSAQYEHSIAVTAEGVRVLTVQNDEGVWEPPGRWTPPDFQDAADV